MRSWSALQPWLNRMGLCVVTDGYLPFRRPSYLKVFACMGYFQSRRYWAHHTEEIRSELRRPDLIAEGSRSALEQIRGINAVCLHIRLGDYVNIPTFRKLFYICDAGYYQRAVQAAQFRVFGVYGGGKVFQCSVNAKHMIVHKSK